MFLSNSFIKLVFIFLKLPSTMGIYDCGTMHYQKEHSHNVPEGIHFFSSPDMAFIYDFTR